MMGFFPVLPESDTSSTVTRAPIPLNTLSDTDTQWRNLYKFRQDVDCPADQNPRAIFFTEYEQRHRKKVSAAIVQLMDMVVAESDLLERTLYETDIVGISILKSEYVLLKDVKNSLFYYLLFLANSERTINIIARIISPTEANERLFFLIDKGYDRLLEVLLDKYPNIDIRGVDKKGNTPLIYILSEKLSKTPTRQSRLFGLLLKKEVDINVSNTFGVTPLMVAVLNNNKEAVVELIRKDADANRKDEKGNTAMMYAVISNNPEIFEIVANNENTNTNLKNKENISAWTMAFKLECHSILDNIDLHLDKINDETSLEILKFLISTDKLDLFKKWYTLFNVPFIPDGVFDCMCYASIYGNQDVMQFLLQSNPNFNITRKDQKNRNFLILASHIPNEMPKTHVLKKEDFIRFLINIFNEKNQNVEIDHVDSDGLTALGHAIRGKNERITTRLLNEGASIYAGTPAETLANELRGSNSTNHDPAYYEILLLVERAKAHSHMQEISLPRQATLPIKPNAVAPE